ncbi:MAG: hypothetical protein ABR562_07160 [Thermoplasmatota archaeon]
MPIVVDAQPHLVLRRLAKEDLDGLADVIPALGGDVDPWPEGAWE